MASIKITELNELSGISENDVLPIVDIANDETKKITATNLLKNEYSTNEIKTNNKWITGDTIYRKVIDTGDLTDSSRWEYSMIKIPCNINTSRVRVINIKAIASDLSNTNTIDFNNYSYKEHNLENTLRVFCAPENDDLYILIVLEGASLPSWLELSYVTIEYFKY